MSLGLFTFHLAPLGRVTPCAPLSYMEGEERGKKMELINFIGAQASKDGKWLLVTFGRKDTEDKVRWLVPFNANKCPVAGIADADDGKAYVFLSMKKKEEEPKQEAPDAIAEEELPF